LRCSRRRIPGLSSWAPTGYNCGLLAAAAPVDERGLYLLVPAMVVERLREALSGWEHIPENGGTFLNKPAIHASSESQRRMAERLMLDITSDGLQDC
jgi:hypothetical protein